MARTSVTGSGSAAGGIPRRPGHYAAIVLGVLGVLSVAAVSGCAAPHAVSTGPTATPAASSGLATAPSSASPATPTVTATRAPTGQASASPPVPVLGQLTGVFAHGSGFGQVKPAKVFNGGDPTGLVTSIVWQSWGGAQASGTGQSDYVGPSQSVATGTQAQVTIVAFNLGSCDGKRMYQAVEWYFPQHGQAFDPGRYENICTGSYVPSS